MPARPPRVNMHFMVALPVQEWIDAQAYQHQLTRSDVVRTAITVARKHPTELRALLEALAEQG